MKKIVFSSQAKKDLKKYKGKPLIQKALYSTLLQLANGIELPARYRVHKLMGKYKQCLECHVGNDFLLIWKENDVINIIRVGTHSELF